MKFLSPLLCLLLLFAVACTSESTQVSQTSSAAPQNLLEDDQNWEQKGDFSWQLEAKELSLQTAEGQQGGWLIGKESFQDFQLVCQFRVDDSLASSALAFRWNGDASPQSENALLLSIAPNPDQQNPTGTILGIARAIALADSGEWQELSLTVQGESFRILLNGEKINEGSDRRLTSGKLAIQAPNPGHSLRIRALSVSQLLATAISAQPLEEVYRSYTERPMEKLMPDASLQGWTSMGTSSWEVVDNVLHGYSGEEGGFLVHETAHQNFYARFEFKIAKEDNSGIFIRYDTIHESVGVEHSIECNIYDHNGYTHAYSTGSVATHGRAFWDLIDHEQWNEMEIFAHDERIILAINGKKSCEVTVAESLIHPGSICLQAGVKVFLDQGPSHIYFRNIECRNMDGIEWRN